MAAVTQKGGPNHDLHHGSLGGSDGCDPGMLTSTTMADDQNLLSRFGGHAANGLQDDMRRVGAWPGVQAYGCNLGLASLSLKPLTHGRKARRRAHETRHEKDGARGSSWALPPTPDRIIQKTQVLQTRSGFEEGRKPEKAGKPCERRRKSLVRGLHQSVASRPRTRTTKSRFISAAASSTTPIARSNCSAGGSARAL